MKNFAWLFVLFTISGWSQDAYLLLENSVGKIMSMDVKSHFKKKKISAKYSAVKVDEKLLPKMSHEIHHKLHKCGGYFRFHSENELKSFVADIQSNRNNPPKDYFLFDRIDTKKVESRIQNALKDINEINIRETIEKLSSYENRYYRSKSGIEAAHWIADKWKGLVQNRSDAEVLIYEHKHFKQPSVILKIEGESKEALVLGGHLDSIAQGKHAPGADDNASGIATLTEIIRVISDRNFRPRKTLFFMGYAAEEVGLLGSKDIARNFVKKGDYDLQAVLQFDMTNFKGSEKSIYLYTDYTSKKLTAYLGTLIDRYVKVPWGYSRCGYACSDHASWNAYGIPAAFPFEAEFRHYNRNIHTSKDLINVSDGNALHATNFAKLGLSAVLELGNILTSDRSTDFFNRF